MANLRRLIDLDEIKPICFPSTEMDGLDVVRYLETLPTVDAVEVVHGRWSDWENDPMWKQCTACKFIIQYSYSKDCKFCPNCGAKMDGGSNG